MTAVVCRGGRSCDRPATHAIRVAWPGGIPGVTNGWEPLCWSHAIEDACQVGHEEARHQVTLCSLGYAAEHEWPLIRYAAATDEHPGRYEVIEP